MNNIIDNYNPIQTIINNENNENNENLVNSTIEKIYIINLDTDKLREKYIKFLMSKLNINYVLITVKKPSQYIYNKVIRLSKPLSKKMTIGEVGCYLSHMWCLNNVIKNNYNNVLILEDDIIVHKDFHSLFAKYISKTDELNESNNEKIKYDFLMLGAADHGFNKGNKELIKGNIYIPKHYVIMATHAIYYSLYGAKRVFDYRLKYPVYFDKDLKAIFSFFDQSRTGVCYPNLFTVENSTTNMGHNFGITKYKYNEYYYKECYYNFDFNDYHFIYLDLFPKFMLEDTSEIQKLSAKELIRVLLMNYFNNDRELTDFHYTKLSIDFFSIEEYRELLEIAKNRYTILYHIGEGQKFDKPIFPNWGVRGVSPLFHKQHMDVSLQNKKISYEIVKETPLTKKYAAHLHCFDIDKFEEIYGPYIKKITEHMDIIVTYCYRGSIRYAYPPNPPQRELNYISGVSECPPTILKIENKGQDIGGKFVVMDYLKTYNETLKHKYILFLHENSSINDRDIYFNSLINNLSYILEKSLREDIGGFFPPTIHRGDDMAIIYNEKYLADGLLKKFLYWETHFDKLYFDEFIKYFGLSENDITLFPHGNCYVLHADIANKLFGDANLYNCLNSMDNSNNSVNSFDYNWVKTYYNIQYNEIDFIYEAYKKFGLMGNSFQIEERNNIGLDDTMVEYVFERIIFLLIANKNMNIEILSNKKNKEQIRVLSKNINECYNMRILYENFDWESYINNNKDLANYKINNKMRAWMHWSKYGWIEERKI